ncbi:MAG: magnesium transporter [Bacteroidia bacterium]|nr:magnesium transporter [Bacteroidia bacterium]
MTTQTTFFLSQILGRRFYSSDGNITGKVKDFLVDLTALDPTPGKPVRPKVIAVKVKVGMYERVLDFSSLEIIQENRSSRIVGTEIEEISTAYLTNVIWLKESILNRQIVDINGKKLEKVWDIRLVYIPSGTFAIAVNVGFSGWLRKQALLPTMERILGWFGFHIPIQQILWDDIESVDIETSKLLLSKSTSKLTTLHPSDLADIIEDLDKATRTYVFAALDEEQAADVLEEMEPNAQIQIIESLPLEKAADLLEIMDADEAADILEELQVHKAELLLKEMKKESSAEVRVLLEYDDNEVGSIMNTEVYTLSADLTVEEAISAIRKRQPEPVNINTLFITEEDDRFISSIPIAELVIAEPSKLLSEIIESKPVTVLDTDKIDILAEIVSKYNLLSVPVINTENQLEGMVLIEDIVDDLLDQRKTK